MTALDATEASRLVSQMLEGVKDSQVRKDNWRAGWRLATFSPKEEDKENLSKVNKENSEVAEGQITGKRHTKNEINKVNEKYQLRR